MSNADIPSELVALRSAAARVAVAPTHDLGDVVLVQVLACDWQARQRALVQAAQAEQTVNGGCEPCIVLISFDFGDGLADSEGRRVVGTLV